MINKVGCFALGLVVLFSCGQTRANYVIYTNRTTFESALKVGTETTETFNEITSGSGTPTFYLGGSLGPNTNPSLTTGITVTSSGLLRSGNSVDFAGLYPNGSNGTAAGTYLVGDAGATSTSGLTVTAPSTSITPNVDYSGVGADVAAFGANALVFFYGTTSLGEHFSGSVSVSGTTNLGFIGIATTNPYTDYITSIGFTTYNLTTSTASSNDITLDNFSFGAAVPEPGSMALLTVGGLLLGARTIRRRVRSMKA